MVQLLAGIISLRRVRGPNPGRSHGSADTLPLRHSANWCDVPPAKFLSRFEALLSFYIAECYIFKTLKPLKYRHLPCSLQHSADNKDIYFWSGANDTGPSIAGLQMCVLGYIFTWHRGSSGQRPWVRLLHSLVHCHLAMLCEDLFSAAIQDREWSSRG